LFYQKQHTKSAQEFLSHSPVPLNSFTKTATRASLLPALQLPSDWGIANISDKTGVKQKLGSSNSDF
jgi:hypothetical protein